MADEIDKSKYKYKDEKGYYALTNTFDSISSPLSKNKNRGYIVYYREEDKDVVVRDEYNRETDTFGPVDEELVRKGHIPISLLEMSATPLNNHIDVEVNPEDVIKEGMIKEDVIVNEGIKKEDKRLKRVELIRLKLTQLF